jgi:hypothetical protein
MAAMQIIVQAAAVLRVLDGGQRAPVAAPAWRFTSR